MDADNRAWISECIRDSRAAVDSLEEQIGKVSDAANLVVSTFERGCKILTCGNGGSAAEAMHMSEEAVGRFRSNRVSLPAVALVADGTALTCIGNDYGFDEIFARQIEGLGNEGDLLAAFSTSGNGRNLIRAVEAARAKRMNVLLILGRDGGRLAGKGDIEITIRGTDSGRIQEAHQLLMHILLDAVDRRFVPQGGTP
ncbi:MAG: SIS domain-containing protein [Kiritimatiellae bacterium]|nr:SIS domain-containing protein [Kiritimatiellia bacterium]